MDEEKKSLMSKDKKKNKKDKLRDDEASKLDHESRCSYLCLNCLCSNNALKELTCCGCFPISCGVYTIAVLIILLVILIFCEIFFQLEDDDPYWYVIAALCCLGPAMVGAAFSIMFIMRNRNWTRILMVWATILVTTSVVLVVSWDAIYYILLDRHKNVEIGT